MDKNKQRIMYRALRRVGVGRSDISLEATPGFDFNLMDSEWLMIMNYVEFQTGRHINDSEFLQAKNVGEMILYI